MACGGVAADARTGAVPGASSGTPGPCSVAKCACSARSRRSGIQPVTGAVSPSRRFRLRKSPPRALKRSHGGCIQDPGSAVNRSPEGPRVFLKFPERVRPPSKVQNDSAPENGTGGDLKGWRGTGAGDERLALARSPAATATRFPPRCHAVKPSNLYSLIL